MLVAHADHCVSCGRCTLACSFQKSNTFNPAKSRIKIIRAEPNVDVPVICIHCGLCIPACPTEAITRNRRTGAVVVNEERCNGCGQCIPACPYGVITIDPDTIKVIKCDLCDGSPACVQACNFKALSFEKRNNAVYFRQLETAFRITRRL
jgi:Fe-S-cluster-containing dehydrogenase component